MGRQSRRRREARTGRAAPPGVAFGAPYGVPPVEPEGPDLWDLWVPLAREVLYWRHRRQPEAAADTMAELRTLLRGADGRRALAELRDELSHVVTEVWGKGWQPADMLRFGGRELPSGAVEVLGDVLVHDLARYAPTTVTPSWQDQLAAAGATAWWPADRHPLAARVERTGGDVVEVCLDALPVFIFLGTLLPLERLDPLPGQWREAVDGAGDVDQRVLERVRLLLAKAEATTYPAEAETFTAGAQALMARHSIDRALIDAARPEQDAPRGRRIGIDRPYEQAKMMLLDVVATTNRCRAVWSKELGFATVIGFAPDLAATETLFTSLLLQSTRELTGHGSKSTRWGTSRTRSFRQSFLTAFADRIGQRLEEATQAVVDEVAAQESASGACASAGRRQGGTLVHLLEQRAEEVDAAVDELFGTLRSASVPIPTDHEGWTAGVAAADRADLARGARVAGR